MTIREATAAEAPAVAALVDRAYARWVPVIGRKPLPMLDDYDARIAARQVFVLADREIAGILVIEDHPDHLYLDNIAVDPSRQGQGIGRLLLDFVDARARALGHRLLKLHTNVLMLSNQALYARHGWVETHRGTEQGINRVYMEKRLG